MGVGERLRIAMLSHVDHEAHIPRRPRRVTAFLLYSLITALRMSDAWTERLRGQGVQANFMTSSITQQQTDAVHSVRFECIGITSKS